MRKRRPEAAALSRGFHIIGADRCGHFKIIDRGDPESKLINLLKEPLALKEIELLPRFVSEHARNF